MALVAAVTACGSSSASPSTPVSSATSAGTAGAPARCGPAGASTLASSSAARVYAWHSEVYGCAFVHGRSFRLGSVARALREARVQPVVIAGIDAAYGLANFGVDTVTAFVEVRRLTDDQPLAVFPVTRTGVVEGIESVTSLVLRSDGAVAWIGVARSIVRHGQVIEVHATGAPPSTYGRFPSTDRVLDSGPQVAPASLRLHGSTLTWKHGTATRRATLH